MGTQYAAGYPNMVARNIWPLSLSNVKDSKAKFETTTATCGGEGTSAGTADCTVSGEVIFSQNGLKDVLCGNNGGLTINLQGTGMKTGNKYKLFIDTATDCTLSSTAGTRKEIVEITAPVLGSNSETAVDGMAVGIMDTTSAAKTVACGTAVLA